MFKLYKGAWIDDVPPHLQTELTQSLVYQLLSGGGYFVRTIYDFDGQSPTNFWYVIKDSFGGLDELSSKVRNQVKKSLKVYDVIRLTPEEMLTCHDLFNKAIDSYRVKANKVSFEDFKARIEHETNKGNVEYWGSRNKLTGEIVAIAFNLIQEDICNYSTLKADPKALKGSTYPYYGLIYKMNEHYLKYRGFRYVNDGARSITEHSNIQHFLIDKFKFRKAYCKLSIYYRPWVKIIIKMLFPFRNYINNNTLRAILKQEEWRFKNRG